MRSIQKERSRIDTEILVVGSGAGGAITAAMLAEQGHSVLIIEEGPNIDTLHIAPSSTEAMRKLYRNGGMTPILGKRSIGFVEGCCVGGSTEINTGFWHRLPPDSYHRWKADALLDEFSPEIMEPYFQRIEGDLSVSLSRNAQTDPSSQVLKYGAEKLGWASVEVPRCQSVSENGSASPGAKQSMQRSYIPRALKNGAKLISDCRANNIVHDKGRVRCS